MNDREKLERAIAQLEAQRDLLGDETVDASISVLQEKLASLQPRSLQQQRKMATVLFADLSGFTKLSESIDAEDVGEVMNTIWQRLDRIIVEHGGAIDKHMGDAVMALWGANVAREDAPERAIRAGLEMQAALASFDEKQQMGLSMRVGVNTGPVLMTPVGITGEYTAIGDTVNVARRLEQTAPSGALIISYDTYRHVRGVFDVRPIGVLQVKGRAHKVEIYLVERAKPRAFRVRARGVEGIETRMVGRDAEFQRLQGVFRDVLGGAGTRIVTVIGDAGVGKSRLLYEFDNWVELQPDRFTFFQGRAVPETVNRPYGLIRDLFAHRFEIQESDNITTVTAKFRRGMERFLPPDRIDLVGHLVGFDFSASPAVRDLLGSPSFGRLATAYLAQYFRQLTGSPTVIFLEDIHWADDDSLAIVEYLAAELSAAPLLVVCLTRPTLLERRPDWGQGAAYDEIRLNPLPVGDTQELVGEILQKADQIPDVLSNLVVEGSEGNPYYVEEIIKVLIEDGVILCGEDQWYVELDRLTTMRVPPSLTGVLQARLDSLPAEEREILQRASVVGRVFWGAALDALEADGGTEIDERRIPILLQHLCARELIFAQRRSTFAGTAEYVFQHAILHDVVYETVLLKLRRIYHAQVAAWLEENAGDRLGEYLGLIARHYELAGESIHAASCLQRLGEELHRASSYHSAVTIFERALSLLPESELLLQASLRGNLGYAHRQLSNYPLAKQFYEQGLALVRNPALTAPEVEVKILNGLGWTLMGEGAYIEAQGVLKQALDLAAQIADQEGTALSLYNLGDVAYRLGQSEQARQYAEQSLEIYQSLGNRQGMAFALRVLGFAALMRNRYAEAAEYQEQSRKMYDQIGDRWGVATCYINLGETVRREGRYREAAQFYEKSLPIFEEIDNQMGTAIGATNLGHAYIALGEYSTARHYLHQALERSVAIGALSITLEALADVALLQMEAGQYVEAAELLGLLTHHPAFNQEIGDYIASPLSFLRATLPSSEMEAAMARWQEQDLGSVVRDLTSQSFFGIIPT